MAVLFLSFLNHFIIEPHSYFGEGAALISLGLIIVYGSVFFKGRLFTKVLIPTLIFFLIFTINVIIILAYLHRKLNTIPVTQNM